MTGSGRAIRHALALLATAASGLPAQQGFRDSVTVVPGAAYAKGASYRFFFGDHYRDLWTTSLRVPVLELSRYAGGLRPIARGGGQQTRSLHLEGADGREYAFRSVDKDPTAVLPPGLRETFAERIVQDQISAGHPVGALVVPRILAAAGVLHAPPILVVMPDDPTLGEFRSEFANVLGTLEERPRDADEEDISFAGALEIVSSDRLFEALERDSRVRVDSRAYLRARLVDVFLGDWDRHRDQWRWALVDDSPARRWVPIPRDRDQAFVRFDGLLLGMVRATVPQLVNFGPRYPAIVGATWNGRDLDRRLLVDLDWPAWDSVATDLQDRLTDRVIEEAVARLPAEYRPVDGPRLTRALVARRDGLLQMARDYYRLLAREVDVHATDQADEVRIDRADDRTTEVRIGGSQPWFRRRFDREETRDLRLYLHGGDDRAVVAGPGSGGPTVRLIGGGGDDTLADSSRGRRSRFYDDRGTNTGLGGRIDARTYVAVDDPDDPKAMPHRDWGKKRLGVPFADIGPDAGLQLGWGGRHIWYGFRRKPWASQLTYVVRVATGGRTGKLGLGFRTMEGNSRNFWSVDLLASGLEVLRWHGFGNETTLDPARPTSYYRASQHQISVEPSFGWALGERSLLSIGPRLKYSVTELDDAKNQFRFIGADRPFGTEGHVQAGVGAELEVDTRDVPSAARRGLRIVARGRYYPALLDVTDAFGSLSAEASTYLTASLPTDPTLALKAGGTRLWGTP